jgi:lipopolysaccharide transport system ATP-binding protein
VQPLTATIQNSTSNIQNPFSKRMSNDNKILVKVDGVSKKFCRDLKKSLWYGVKDVASELLPFGRKESGVRSQDSDENREATSSNSKFKIQNSKFPSPSLRDGEFWAVKDVSFELRRGECLGLIGRNGAGKTTLLKMLNGLIKPDAGSIEMRGRVGALIALGAGFNPILTGRENVYVNGSILGLTKEEIDTKIDDIIDFAEIREFIDSPVQSYSSGMQVRLGFAVATAMSPDILILDEVLAVGDAAFRNKCYKRVISLRKKAAVIFVSHGMEQVSRICDKILMLTKGQVHYLGDVPEGVQAYESANEDGSEGDDAFLSVSDPITDFSIFGLPGHVVSGQELQLDLRVDVSATLDHYTIRVLFYNASGGFAADGNCDLLDSQTVLIPGSNHLRCVIPVVPLKNGKYQLAVNLIDSHGDIIIWSYKQHSITVKNAHSSAISDCQVSFQTTRI